MSVEIKDSHLLVNGVHYFRGNATAVSLGDFGRKKSPVFKTTFLEVYDNAGLVDVDLSARVELTVDQKTLRSAMGDLTFAFNGQEGGVSVQDSKTSDWKLCLVHLSMNLAEVEANVLDQADEDDFKNLGKKARVAYQTWVVVTAALAEEIQTAVGLKATVNPGNGIVISGGLGKSNTTKTLVTLSEKSTFAYLLAKRKENGRFTTDQWG